MHVLRGVQVGSEVDEGVNERLAENHGGKPAGGRRRQEQRREGGCPEEKPEAQPFRTAELPQHGREERERVADTFGEPGRAINTATFGQVTATAFNPKPREVQLALRLTF